MPSRRVIINTGGLRGEPGPAGADGTGGGGTGGPITADLITDATVTGKALVRAFNAGAALTTIGAVPTTRTVNGKALSANVTLVPGDIGAIVALTPTASKTAAYTASPGELVMCDATSAGFTVTLPTAPVDKTQVGVKKMDSTTNAVTVSRGGTTDVFESGGNTFTVSTQFRTVVYQYDAANHRWLPIAQFLTVSSLAIPAALSDLSGTVSYDQAAPGTVIGINWNGSVWKIGTTTIAARPTSRTDIVCHFIGGTTAPSFATAGVDVWDQDVS
jgi:hypothetical protein